MTSTTDPIAPTSAIPATTGRRLGGPGRFVLAFVLGLLGALAVGAGALYAYDASFADRVLPGVRVGAVDVGGLTRAEAVDRVRSAFADLGVGSIHLRTPQGGVTIGFDEIGRQADVEAMVDKALAVGRAGTPVERVVAEAQTALRGSTVAPAVRLDADRLSARVTSLAGLIAVDPADASIERTKAGFEVSPAHPGRAVDGDELAKRLVAAVEAPAGPSDVTIDVPVVTLQPAVPTTAADDAATAANRMAASVKLTAGKSSWTIKSKTIRPWIGFETTADGRIAPTLDTDGLRTAVKKIAKQANVSPTNATFLISKSGKIVGVKGGHDGRKLDLDATTAAVAQAVNARGSAPSATPVKLVFSVAKPTFSTAEAEKTAPLMRKISSWTTYFPIYVNNGFGANIWIPALIIDGTVVGPGETFDFWQTVGSVTSAKGYKQGGAIIDGHTEPQGALAGGICSCSTTLFNAALRAGMEMQARKNHFYYIDRYPLGLDATVFISASGATQTMSWKNDTPYPVLIRGYKIQHGSSGYVRFELYSVPNGRRVVIGDPTVRNIRPAADTRQYTSSLPKGVTKRLEYPVDGKDVWRTVSVYQNGKLIRRTTYYSHYSRITGVLLVGTGSSGSSS
ncbi:MAG TPA: peptidoglycan binding domain-containing protein [Candidatus Limnocylindrales bacterium]|nr:peptidoglycan binding domain-containing protein [Candidatus Limnocylindrales bacterium]